MWLQMRLPGEAEESLGRCRTYLGMFLYTHTHTHTHTKQFHAGHLPLASQIFSTLLCPLCGLRSQAPHLQAVVRDWRLESSDVHFPGSLCACTYLGIVIGTAAAVLWDRSCLFPQGVFIIILFIYSLLHCLFASTQSKSQEGRDHTDVFTPVSPGWLRVGAQ